MGCQLVLITNRLLHTGFQFIQTLVTLNDVIALILHYFTKFDIFAGQLCHSG